jgi:hypothetical protein
MPEMIVNFSGCGHTKRSAQSAWSNMNVGGLCPDCKQHVAVQPETSEEDFKRMAAAEGDGLPALQASNTTATLTGRPVRVAQDINEHILQASVGGTREQSKED